MRALREEKNQERTRSLTSSVRKRAFFWGASGFIFTTLAALNSCKPSSLVAAWEAPCFRKISVHHQGVHSRDGQFTVLPPSHREADFPDFKSEGYIANFAMFSMGNSHTVTDAERLTKMLQA